MKPEIKKYLDVLKYLQDFYSYRKSQNRAFSYDVWAKQLGVSDKSYIRLLVLGKRPINPKVAAALCSNLELPPEEEVYFLNLIQYTQAKTREHKDLFGKKLVSLLRNELDRLEIQAHYEFLSNPILPRLQVMLSFKDISQSASNLAWLLGVKTEEADKGLEKLLQLGLVEKKNDGYSAVKKSFKVPDHFGHLGLDAFYRRNLEEAQNAIDLPKEERRFKSLFLPLNPDEFGEFLSNLQVFVNEQLFKFNADEYSGRRLYQAHFNLIPVTSPTKDDQTK